MTGLQAAAELSRRRPELRTLMLSMHDNEQYFFEALASGYVLKTAANRDLIEACRAAMRGEPFLCPAAVQALIRDYLDRARRGDETPGDPLTPRELEVVKLIAEGHTSEEIAGMLFISKKTVDRHRANVLEKLGMRNRVERTRYAIRRGLVEPKGWIWLRARRAAAAARPSPAAAAGPSHGAVARARRRPGEGPRRRCRLGCLRRPCRGSAVPQGEAVSRQTSRTSRVTGGNRRMPRGNRAERVAELVGAGRLVQQPVRAGQQGRHHEHAVGVGGMHQRPRPAARGSEAPERFPADSGDFLASKPDVTAEFVDAIANLLAHQRKRGRS
jgi:DNA-binding NarL/FixJ family response regulator